MVTSIDIVIPVLNEEVALPRCVETLSEFIDQNPGRDWQITVADNGSTDRTYEVAAELSDRGFPVSYTHLTLPTNREV